MLARTLCLVFFFGRWSHSDMYHSDWGCLAPLSLSARRPFYLCHHQLNAACPSAWWHKNGLTVSWLYPADKEILHSLSHQLMETGEITREVSWPWGAQIFTAMQAEWDHFFLNNGDKYECNNAVVFLPRQNNQVAFICTCFDMTYALKNMSSVKKKFTLEDANYSLLKSVLC